MSKTVFSNIQKRLKDLGYYAGVVDGLWGNMSQTAFDEAMSTVKKKSEGISVDKSKIAWGAKVSDLFLDKVISICDKLGMPAATGPSDLMACMAWESGETFSPSIRNGAGSGATGLIQFMPSTALAYWYTPAQIAKMTAAQKKANGIACCDKLAKMTAEEQLDYVEEYFMPYKGRLKNLGDMYLAILWPAGIGKADSWVLWEKDERPTTYRQNIGLDVNKDGAITRGECLKKVTEKLERGKKFMRKA